MALYTRYPPPPAPPYRNKLTETGYRFLWNLHRAKVKPVRLNNQLQLVGLNLLDPASAQQRVYTYQDCQQRFPVEHRALITMLQYYELEEPQFAALLSLGLGLGPVGLAGSRVLWDVTQGHCANLETSWKRYVWLGDKFNEAATQREVEYRCFVYGFTDPWIQYILTHANWQPRQLPH